jgi:hypothetical protein
VLSPYLFIQVVENCQTEAGPALIPFATVLAAMVGARFPQRRVAAERNAPAERIVMRQMRDVLR